MGEVRGKIDRMGPLIEVQVMATHAYVAALKKAGRRFLAPRTILALLDTGASSSAVDTLVVNGLGLQPKDYVPSTPPRRPDTAGR